MPSKRLPLGPCQPRPVFLLYSSLFSISSIPTNGCPWSLPWRSAAPSSLCTRVVSPVPMHNTVQQVAVPTYQGRPQGSSVGHSRCSCHLDLLVDQCWLSWWSMASWSITLLWFRVGTSRRWEDDAVESGQPYATRKCLSRDDRDLCIPTSSLASERRWWCICWISATVRPWRFLHARD